VDGSDSPRSPSELSSPSSLFTPPSTQEGTGNQIRKSLELWSWDFKQKMAAEEEQELDLGNSDVCTKYREAGRIANLAMQGIKTMVRTFIRVHLKSAYARP